MGQRQEGGTLQFEELYRKYSVFKEDPERGLWRLTALDSGQAFVMKEMRLTDSQAMKAQADNLRRRTALAHDNYLPAVEYYLEADESFCSASFRIGVVFQLVELSLAEESASRLEENKPFEERELWSILCSAVVALCHLASNGLSHGALSPQAIFITQDGQVKLGDPALVQLLATPQHAYHSPQAFKGKVEDPQKDDVYALGMTVLHTALLEPCHNCYLNADVNEQLLRFKLKKLAHQYSDTLCSFVQSMLTKQATERPALREIENALNMLLSTLQPANNSINVSRVPDQNSVEDVGRPPVQLASDQPDLPSQYDRPAATRTAVPDWPHNQPPRQQKHGAGASPGNRQAGIAQMKRSQDYVRISQLIVCRSDLIQKQNNRSIAATPESHPDFCLKSKAFSFDHTAQPSGILPPLYDFHRHKVSVQTEPRSSIEHVRAITVSDNQRLCEMTSFRDHITRDLQLNKNSAVGSSLEAEGLQVSRPIVEYSTIRSSKQQPYDFTTMALRARQQPQQFQGASIKKSDPIQMSSYSRRLSAQKQEFSFPRKDQQVKEHTQFSYHKKQQQEAFSRHRQPQSKVCFASRQQQNMAFAKLVPLQQVSYTKHDFSSVKQPSRQPQEQQFTHSKHQEFRQFKEFTHSKKQQFSQSKQHHQFTLLKQKQPLLQLHQRQFVNTKHPSDSATVTYSKRQTVIYDNGPDHVHGFNQDLGFQLSAYPVQRVPSEPRLMTQQDGQLYLDPYSQMGAMRQQKSQLIAHFPISKANQQSTLASKFHPLELGGSSRAIVESVTQQDDAYRSPKDPRNPLQQRQFTFTQEGILSESTFKNLNMQAYKTSVNEGKSESKARGKENSREQESWTRGKEGEQMFTDPRLLEMIERDMRRIQQSRVSSGQSEALG